MALGSFLAPPSCYEIGTCKSCWSNVETYKTSEYCSGGGSCKVVPYIDQHNSLVDVLNCACSQASANQYTEPELNSKINDLYRSLTGITGTTQDICDSQNPMLVKWFFD